MGKESFCISTIFINSYCSFLSKDEKRLRTYIKGTIWKWVIVESQNHENLWLMHQNNKTMISNMITSLLYIDDHLLFWQSKSSNTIYYWICCFFSSRTEHYSFEDTKQFFLCQKQNTIKCPISVFFICNYSWWVKVIKVKMHLFIMM